MDKAEKVIASILYYAGFPAVWDRWQWQENTRREDELMLALCGFSGTKQKAKALFGEVRDKNPTQSYVWCLEAALKIAKQGGLDK